MDISRIGITEETHTRRYSAGTLADSQSLLRPPSSCESPYGGTHRDETPEDRENNPMCISSKHLTGPYVTDDNDHWDVPYPESLASSLIYGDTIENNLIEMSPHLSEDSVTVPINGSRFSRWRLSAICESRQRDARPPRSPTNLKEDDTILLTSSASLLTDECEKIQEPVKARLQYHRRKRLEWRLQSSQVLPADRKLQDAASSWTIYDDLLEELEDSFGTTTHWRDRSGLADASDSFNGLGVSRTKELYQIIESYMQQKFRDFDHRFQLSQPHNQILSAKTYSEMATMTEAEGKEDEEEPTYPNQVNCLPTCRCVPKRVKMKR